MVGRTGPVRRERDVVLAADPFGRLRALSLSKRRAGPPYH